MSEQEPAEPTLTEIFSQTRADKCFEVWRRILNNWLATRILDCRIVADEPLEGKTLEDLGKSYLSLGIGDDLTRLPMLDALIVFDLLKQYTAHLEATGAQLKKFKMKTSYTQSEVFGLLNEMHKAGFRIEIQP